MNLFSIVFGRSTHHQQPEKPQACDIDWRPDQEVTKSMLFYETRWRELIEAGVDKLDLLRLLDDNPFETHIRLLAARTLMQRHKADLTIDELGEVIRHTPSCSGTHLRIEAGEVILKNAQNCDDLAYVLHVPKLRVAAARKILARNPSGIHHYMRCTDIPAVVDEAMEKLLALNPPRDLLLHILRFKPALAPYVRKYLEETGRRVDFTPAMREIIKQLETDPDLSMVH